MILLITTSKFTVAAVGLSPFEQLNRVHVRYYFFVFPLLLVLFLAVYERLDWAKSPATGSLERLPDLWFRDLKAGLR